MREIKFRGKRIDGGGWVFGSLKRYLDHERVFAILEEVEGGSVYSVIPETIGQFTGLKDKARKEIYEGDLYIGERGYMPSRGYKKKSYPERIKVICVVEWSVYDAGWRGKEIGPIKEHMEADKNAPYDYYHTSLSGSPKGVCSWLEVVGNIYENKELIK